MEEAAFFLDIFTVNQHMPPWHEDPPKSIDHVLKSTLCTSGRTVLVLSPWEKPTSFTRVWCLFEIMTTLQEGATLDVALSAAERERFVKTLVNDFEDIMKNISTIDARKAEAAVQADRDAIFGLIEASPGGWATTYSRGCPWKRRRSSWTSSPSISTCRRGTKTRRSR